MIDRYTRSEFEAALPVVNGRPLWQGLGLRSGEHCYTVAVKPGVLIYVRSSVKADDLAADTAADSIRCWLSADDRGTPLGSKPSRWISRVNGWDQRLTETLRALWRLGHQLTPCPRCNVTMLALKVEKEGENKGKWFTKCPACGHRGNGWLRTEKDKANAA